MMKQQHNEYWRIELADEIRLNRLIRGRLDFEAFTSWYRSLIPNQQACLVSTLREYAYEAGVDDGVYAEALQGAGLIAADPAVQQAQGILRQTNAGFWIYQHLPELAEGDRFTVFTISVHLFAVAEGRVFRAHTKDHCNHWWHRDLLDDRVVQAILNDPKFYMTSMKDDDRIKRPAA